MNAIRPGGGLIGVAGLVLALVLAASLSSPASDTAAQTAGASCDPPFQRGPGGQTISAGLIRVDLIQGYNYLWNAPAVGATSGTLRICIIEYFSTITIDTTSGRETSRVVAIPSATTVLDLIAASARSLLPPTPTPRPPSAATGSSGSSCTSTICPPNTGDAGLR
jgi:hypothetical protein